MMKFIKKLLKIVAIIFIALMALGIILSVTSSPEEKAAREEKRLQQKADDAVKDAEKLLEKEAARQKAIEEMPSYTARDIAKAFDRNTVSADSKFKGKQFKVSGTIGDISTDLFGDPYVTLKGGVNPFMEPQFGFSKKHIDSLADLGPGDRVNLICTGKGDIAKTPMNEDCFFQ